MGIIDTDRKISDLEPEVTVSKTSSILLVIALITHSIFEGIAVGI